jgi:hypothetical protein
MGRSCNDNSQARLPPASILTPEFQVANMPSRQSRPTTASPAGASSPTAAVTWRVGLLHPFLRLRFRLVESLRSRFRLVVIAALVAFAGCEKEGIQHYQAPKPPQYRLLGAIVPRGDSFWFFKLTGPEDAVKEHQKEFDAFLDSLTFADGKPPTWKLPAGWREGEADAMRVATLLLGPSDDPLELAVSEFPRNPANEKEALLANVDRWRKQMGLPPIEADRLAEIAPPRDLHGIAARVVEMVGPKPGKTRRAPGMPPARPAPAPRREGPPAEEPARPGLRYTKPDGWKEPERKKSGRLAEFVVADDRGMAEVTVTSFPGDVGGVAANVNRCRDQVGLPGVSEAEARRAATPLTVGGLEGGFVDLTGPDGRQRLLVVLVPRGERTWFFKMLGPAELVSRQKSAFEAFVKSVQFE